MIVGTYFVFILPAPATDSKLMLGVPVKQKHVVVENLREYVHDTHSHFRASCVTLRQCTIPWYTPVDRNIDEAQTFIYALMAHALID